MSVTQRESLATEQHISGLTVKITVIVRNFLESRFHIGTPDKSNISMPSGLIPDRVFSNVYRAINLCNLILSCISIFKILVFDTSRYCNDSNVANGDTNK